MQVTKSKRPIVKENTQVQPHTVDTTPINRLDFSTHPVTTMGTTSSIGNIDSTGTTNPTGSTDSTDTTDSKDTQQTTMKRTFGNSPTPYNTDSP